MATAVYVLPSVKIYAVPTRIDVINKSEVHIFNTDEEARVYLAGFWRMSPKEQIPLCQVMVDREYDEFGSFGDGIYKIYGASTTCEALARAVAVEHKKYMNRYND